MTPHQVLMLNCIIAGVAVYHAGMDYDDGAPGWWIHIALGPGCMFLTFITGVPLFTLFTLGWVYRLVSIYIERRML